MMAVMTPQRSPQNVNVVGAQGQGQGQGQKKDAFADLVGLF